MYTCTFGLKSLSQMIRKSDFSKDSKLKCNKHIENTLMEAVQIAKLGFANAPPMLQTYRTGRTLYQVTHFPTELVLRKAAKNLEILFEVKQSNRTEIIQKIHMFCKENIPFKVIRLDIKSFYSSINQAKLCKILDRRLQTTPSTYNVLNRFIQRCRDQNIAGVPQGVSVSAALSELYLSDFDNKLKNRFSPYYLARYVDDIIMILGTEIDNDTIHNGASKLLPNGLTFNETKSRIVTIPGIPDATTPDTEMFDYLGFEFTICGLSQNKKKRFAREVRIDISKSKVNKQKTRLVRSMLQFQKDKNFQDLRDRIRLITANYSFFDKRDGRMRQVGLRHQYRLIDLPSKSIDDLDKFRLSLVLSGKIGKNKRVQLTKWQQDELRRLSFRSGFVNEVCFNFRASRLRRLMRCWKYV